MEFESLQMFNFAEHIKSSLIYWCWYLLVQDDMVGAHRFGFVGGDHFGIVSRFHIDLQLYLRVGTIIFVKLLRFGDRSRKTANWQLYKRILQYKK